MGQYEDPGGRAHRAVALGGASDRARGRRGVSALGWFGLLLMVCVLVACSGPVPAPVSPPAPQAPRPAPGGTSSASTVVSLTFDDGNWSQYAASSVLLEHGMRATFYVNTGLVDRGNPSVMTWDQLRALRQAGNDIGGHTRDHLHITQLAAADRRSQVCGDRDRLVAQGMNPVSFAYPFGEHDAATEALVRSCGYRTARITGGFNSTHDAETIPPADPYTVASLTSGKEDGSNPPLQLNALESAVTTAANRGGGWVPIALHTVCQRFLPDYQACMKSDGPIDYDVLSDFLGWLQHDAPPGTVVEPVSEVTNLP